MGEAKIFLVLLVVAGIHIGYYYPQVPSQMASHFDSAGQPNGFSSKDTFFLFYGGIVLFFGAMFGGLAYGLSKIPLSLVNVPHKEYWFNEENKVASYAFMKKSLFRFGNIGVVMIIAICHLAIEANLQKKPLDSKIWWILGLYLVYTVLWVVQMFKRFPHPKNS